MDKARQIALKVLYEVDKNDAYSNIALDEALRKARKDKIVVTAQDVGFISQIVYGTTSWRLTLDEVIKKYSNVRIKKISPWILNILRLSIYQILFLDKVPKSAAVNEGVNLAKRYGHKASSNFVNAILRKVDKKDYEAFFEIENDVERISKTTSMPEWLIEELRKDQQAKEQGENEDKNKAIKRVEAICRASNLKPQVHARVNSLKTTQEALMEELSAKKAEIENFLVLENAKNIENIGAFQEGKFTIQDEIAGLIALLLDPKPQDKVLDACSSPGGKTTFMAELMNNEGEIIAWDLHSHRVKLVEDTAKRLGIGIIKTQVKDATIYEEKYKNTFDKILLDVPCLGFGVLKRKPDIKWKRKKEEIQEIKQLQLQILQTCSNYLKPKGELVYSTCSILKEENEEVIEEFLKTNPNFKITKVDLEPYIKEEKIKKNVENGNFIQVYQNEITDGFFIAKLQKA